VPGASAQCLWGGGGYRKAKNTHKSQDTDQIPAEMIKAGVRTVRSETHKLNSIGITRKCLSSGRSQSLYLFIKSVIKQTVVIIKAHNSYQLHAKFYQTTFCQGNSIYTGNYWGTSTARRRTRSTTDQIFCIRQILAKKLQYSKEVHQLLKGFKKAYDSTGRKVFLILTSSYLSIVCVEGHGCTWSHSMTHTQ
jgi:hypothetical protein